MATKTYISLDKLRVYDEKIKALMNSKDAAVLQDAKDYADGLASNYDAAGSAASALEQAQTYADGKDAAIAAAKKAGDDAAAAAAVADGKAVAAQGEVDALETYVGTFTHDTAKSVVEYINAKTDGIATSGNLEALAGRVTAVEGDVTTIKGDYLKAADKEELAGDIADVQTAVDTEKSRAEGIEAGLRTDVDAIKADYLKAADKEELVQSIGVNAAAIERLTNGVSAEEIDGVNDLIQYVKDHGTEVTGMQGDIADNADAIAAEAERAKGEEAKNAQAAADAKTAADNAQAAADAEAERAKGIEGGLDTRLKAVEAAVGESGSVADDIATAKQEAIDAAAAAADTKDEAVLAAAKKYADDEDALIEARVEALETASATHALASDLTALTGRVTTAEGEIDTLQTEMDAVEAKALANEGAIGTINTNLAKKADSTALDNAVTRIATLETWHSDFVEVSEAEINAMFTA